MLTISSDAAVAAYPHWGAYGATKAAADQWAAVLTVEEPALRVWWVDPGAMRTRMLAAAEPGEDLSEVPEPAQVAPALWRLLAQRQPSGRYTLGQLAEGNGGDPAGAESATHTAAMSQVTSRDAR